MTYQEFTQYEIEMLERRIDYLETIVNRQNKIRREIFSYLINNRDNINVSDALDIIYPRDVYTVPGRPEKGKKEE